MRKQTNQRKVKKKTKENQWKTKQIKEKKIKGTQKEKKTKNPGASEAPALKWAGPQPATVGPLGNSPLPACLLQPPTETESSRRRLLTPPPPVHHRRRRRRRRGSLLLLPATHSPALR